MTDKRMSDERLTEIRNFQKPMWMFCEARGLSDTVSDLLNHIDALRAELTAAKEEAERRIEAERTLQHQLASDVAVMAGKLAQAERERDEARALVRALHGHKRAIEFPPASCRRLSRRTTPMTTIEEMVETFCGSSRTTPWRRVNVRRKLLAVMHAHVKPMIAQAHADGQASVIPGPGEGYDDYATRILSALTATGRE